MLHIGSMLIFFVVVLETKKLLIGLFVLIDLPEIQNQLLKAALEERYSDYVGLIFEEHL